ncbi:cytochrome P450 [Mycobacterium sp. 94-17]|uniref:cytochrome P450 n=1 Tax=Mycobacterium sp. 94-17 TaxID=2986147 RepID=UPI002D1F7960|nr:cytochrome P450 [Mycobacterium sp. 94-17]MEB4209159.1 cytochrome P450 [Mycobacterium sp. 94-17]
MVANAQLPFEQAHPLQFAPVLRELLSHGAVHRVRTPVGDPAWLVTRYSVIVRLLADDRLGGSHPEPVAAARMGESVLYGGPTDNADTEEADHARWRALLQPQFSPKRLRALRPKVESLTAGLLDELAVSGPPGDLHAAVALPLPLLVICEVLGVPHRDRERFRAWTTEAAAIRDHGRSERGMNQLCAYARELIGAKRRHPGDDVISRWCATEGLSDGEIADLVVALLWAGHHTAVVQIGHSVLVLLANPEQWRALADHPALASNAVEETLRASHTCDSVIVRYARTEMEIEGAVVEAGDLVLLSHAAAQHDPSAFDDPDRVDITRPAPKHLAFGHGTRHCIGAPLARIELNAVIYQLAKRFPTMRLAVDLEELRMNTDLLFGGLAELPVRW